MKRWLLLLVLLTATALADPSAQAMNDKAEKLLQQGKVKEAWALWDEVIKKYPKNAEAYAQRGMLIAGGAEGALRKGDRALADKMLVVAIDDLSQAIQYDPKDGISHLNLGLCYYRQEQYTKALGLFDKAVALSPKTAQAYRSRASCRSRLGKDELAIQDYTRCYALDQDASTLFNRGNCHLRLGHRREALADYKTVVAQCKDPKVVQAARSNIEALNEGSTEKPTMGPNQPSR